MKAIVLSSYIAAVILSACGPESSFTGASRTVKEATCASPQELISDTDQSDSAGQFDCSDATPTPPKCLMTAQREGALSTTCHVSLFASGGQLLSPPVLRNGAIFNKNANFWESLVDCPAEGAILLATVSNSSGSSDCKSEVLEIEKPGCVIDAQKRDIELGETIKVTMTSTGGLTVKSTINNIAVAVNQNTNFTPASVGTFILNGIVENPRSAETCTLAINVRPKPTPPVIPASCSLVATRQSPTSLDCDVTISSTGGQINGEPVIAGVGPLVADGTKWTAKVACPASESVVTASVGNAAGTNKCEAKINPIEKPACQIGTNLDTITLGDEVAVTLKSTAGPIVGASVNSVPATPGKTLTFKPATAGIFKFSGTVTNPSGSASCSGSVNVDAIQTATFPYGKQAKPVVADYLFVLDNSVSMSSYLPKVANGLSAIPSEKFPGSARLGVMTTMAAANPLAATLAVHADINTSNYGSCINKEPGFLSLVNIAAVKTFKSCVGVPATYANKYSETVCDSEWFKPFDTNSNGGRCFKAALQNPLHGVGCEPGLLALEQIIQRYQNQGKVMFRDNAAVSVIFVSDEQAGCSAAATRGNRSDPNGTLSRIETAVRNNSNVASLKIHGITPSSSDTANVPANTLPYQMVINAAKGKWFNIHNVSNNYSDIIDQIITAPVDLTNPSFILPTVAKSILGVEVGGVATMDYVFDGTTKITVKSLNPDKPVMITIKYK